MTALTALARSKAGSPQQTLAVGPPARPRSRIGAAGELPHSETVLLLVDVINPLEFPEARRLERAALPAARATARLKARLSAAGAATVYANDNYGRWRSDFRDVYAYCVSRGGAAAELARLLAPTPDDIVILKPRHSAFYATPLDLLLTQMQARRLVVAGLAADICVQLTAMDATLRGYRLWVPRDCTAAESSELCNDALAYMRRVLKAEVARSSRAARPAAARRARQAR